MDAKFLMIVVAFLLLVCGLLLLWAIIAHMSFSEMREDRDYWKSIAGNCKEKLVKLFKRIGI